MKYNFIDHKIIDNYSKYNIKHSLLSRYIKYKCYDEEAIKQLCLSTEDCFKNPFELKNMDTAIFLIKTAIINQQKIMLYGDYDADGICAASILSSVLKKYDVEFGYYIPNRYVDGYGLNTKIVRLIHAKGYKLIITLDNGIDCIEAIELAKKLGINVIVIDRHDILGKISSPYVILHPTLFDDYNYSISSSFIAYKISIALTGMKNKLYLSLASIGTISNRTPLIGENYHLVKLGLQYMCNEKFSALESLSDFPIFYDVNLINNIIIPRLISIGRVSKKNDLNTVIKLFLTSEADKIAEYSALLASYDRKRKKIANHFVEEFCNEYKYENQKCIFIDDERIEEGVKGLVATKLFNKYKVPVFVFVDDFKDKGIKKASIRSIEEFPLNVILPRYKRLLITYGGHSKSSGISLLKSNLEEFKREIEYDALNIKITEVEESIDVIKINENEITLDALKELNTFVVNNIEDELLFRLDGIDKDRLKISVDGKHIIGILNDNVTLVAYNKSHMFDSLAKKVNIIFIPRINRFNGIINVTCNIKEFI